MIELRGSSRVDRVGLKLEFPMNANARLSVFDLTPSEKLQLVEDLWDDLAATPADVPTQGWQIEELDRRKENLTQNPASGLSWDEVKRRIRARYGR
jgi:putative addiction module component (TIGR02574 family)